MTGSAARAGDRSEDPHDSGNWTVSGSHDSALGFKTDDTGADGSMTVTTGEGFDIDASSSESAIKLINEAGDTSITFTDN